MSLDVICFDCDSTLSRIEGIDELARRVGLGDELAQLTDLAMNGQLPLEAVYHQRLQRIKPSQRDIDWLAGRYLDELVDGVREVVAYLHAQQKTLHIISGGLRQAMLPLADDLGIRASCVHAVDIYFSASGDYAGFDEQSPLARNGGKASIIKQLNAQRIVMVGDGNTDLETQQAGAVVIGFGGVVCREKVQQQADFFVADKSLTAILPHLTLLSST